MAAPKTPSVDDILLAKARESLAVYLGICHKTDDGAPAIPPRHLREVVIPALEDDALGDTVVVLPPGAAKTNTLIGLVAQRLGRDPGLHAAFVCDSGPQAEKRSLAIRDMIEYDPVYRAVFPEAVPNRNRGWAADAWYLQRKNKMDKNPSLTAVGAGGSIIGARLHLVVYDDLANEENQKTDLQRKAIWQFLARTGKTRMHPSKGRQIMLGTRWGEDDPIGYCIDRGWHVVHIPALDESGESYWPEYYPTSYLACANDEHAEGQCCMKKELGATDFARTFMGLVYNEETSLFKRGWWRYMDEDEDFTCLKGAITVDTAGWDNTSTRSDFAAVQVTSLHDDRQHTTIEDVQRGRWSFPEVERIITGLRAVWGYPVVVEDVPWARPLIQRLQQTLGWGVIPFKVQGRSKVNRAEAIAPIVEQGRVYLRRGRWNGPFVEEHAAFPVGRNDDMVDANVMAQTYLMQDAGRRKRKVSDFMTLRRQRAELSA